jgi:hypothetical protein
MRVSSIDRKNRGSVSLWQVDRSADVVCVGGREQTATEYRALLSGAGFDLQEVIATNSPLSLLVARQVGFENHCG